LLFFGARCISSDLRVLCKSDEDYKLYKNFILEELLKSSKRKEVEAVEVETLQAARKPSNRKRKVKIYLNLVQ